MEGDVLVQWRLNGSRWVQVGYEADAAAGGAKHTPVDTDKHFQESDEEYAFDCADGANAQVDQLDEFWALAAQARTDAGQDTSWDNVPTNAVPTSQVAGAEHSVHLQQVRDAYDLWLHFGVELHDLNFDQDHKHAFE